MSSYTACKPCFFDRNSYHEVIDFLFYKVIIMIDTIVLVLASHQYQIVEPDKFRPSAKWIYNPSLIPAGICSKQNVTAGQLRHGIYKPYLTLSNSKTSGGNRDIMLKIELSLPKLIFGNNFQELQYKDFPLVLKRLTEELISMGVIVDENVLAKTPVHAIHYSKNIELKDGSTPYHYLQKIKEANASMAVDTNETDYRNDGHCYKLHCNSYEVVFYDKIKELEKSRYGRKRTIEKDNELQVKLFDKLSKRHKYEILRMEVRLNRRQKMKQLFAKLGIKADLTFKALFKHAISKKILLHYLDEVESKWPPSRDFKAKNDEALLAALCNNNPELGPKQILQVFGPMKAFATMPPARIESFI